ncbi:MAG: endolytic transglycosylase MltG [Actinomycetota bacterium]|nr:endolytic transglycosylase MltG [Actinomycetota bacterium]
MKRYDKRSRRDREDLDSRLNVLGASSGRGSSTRGSSTRGSSTRNRKRKPRKKKSNIGPAVVGLLLVVAVLGIIYLIVSSATGGGGEVAGEESGESVQIEVVQGDTLSSVADKLEAEGVIGSSFFFTLQARMGGEGSGIRPGQYAFAADEGNDEIMTKLTEGEAVPTFAVTVPEGLTLEETASAVAENGEISAGEFEEAANRTDYGYAFLEDGAINDTEGFLFPKSYEFEEGTTADQIVNRLLEQYLLETENVDFAAASEELNLTEYELLTVASLIEREAANEAEKPIIASVIYNRIRAEMPLQIDATIQYARGGEQKENLSLPDLEVDSPYNTYQNTGLPPGPIASPSLSSIEAAVNPDETDFVYYVITPDGGEHFFTDNYDEFLVAKEEAGLGGA